MKNKLNKKGFTLIEVLAVLVILSLLLFIAGRSVTNAINASKLESEEIFVAKIGSLIEDYIDYTILNNVSFTNYKNDDVVLTFSFTKCYGYTSSSSTTSEDEEEESEDEEYTEGGVTCKDNRQAEAYLLVKTNATTENIKDKYVTLQDLVEAKLISESDLINPRTKEKCDNLDEAIIYLIKDSDYVYYYYVDLKESCGVRSEDDGYDEDLNILTTIPSGFCTSMSSDTGTTNKDLLASIDDSICSTLDTDEAVEDSNTENDSEEDESDNTNES